ncbi:MAG: hypothetical protein K6E70_00390, partial [Butyrivibrio sp.]|nr:hypothetical protein [Butyrivibrio sp.]
MDIRDRMTDLENDLLDLECIRDTIYMISFNLSNDIDADIVSRSLGFLARLMAERTDSLKKILFSECD